MARGKLDDRRLDVRQQLAFALEEMRGDTFDRGAERLARMRGRKLRRNHPHQRHEWLAPVAVAAG